MMLGQLWNLLNAYVTPTCQHDNYANVGRYEKSILLIHIICQVPIEECPKTRIKILTKICFIHKLF